MKYRIQTQRISPKIKKRKNGILITEFNTKENQDISKYCKKPIIFDMMKRKVNEKAHSLLIKKKTYLLLNKYLKKNELINNLFLDFLKELRKIEILVLTKKIAKIEEEKIEPLKKITKKKKLFFNLKYNIILKDKRKNEFLSFLKLMRKKNIDINFFLKINNNFEKKNLKKKKFNQYYFQQKIFLYSHQIEKSNEIGKFVLKKYENKLIKKTLNKKLEKSSSLHNNILKLNRLNKKNKKNFSKEIDLLFKKNLKQKLKKQKLVFFQKNKNLEIFSNFQKTYDQILKNKIKNKEMFRNLILLKKMSNNKNIMERFKTEEKEKKEMFVNLKNKKDQEILKKKKIFKANVILFILDISSNVTKIYKVLENHYQIKNKNFK